ncbi:hypothetical protein GCM10027442_40090 [Emticicia fontis]
MVLFSVGLPFQEVINPDPIILLQKNGIDIIDNVSYADKNCPTKEAKQNGINHEAEKEYKNQIMEFFLHIRFTNQLFNSLSVLYIFILSVPGFDESIYPVSILRIFLNEADSDFLIGIARLA